MGQFALLAANSRVVEERVGQHHRRFWLHVVEGDVQQPQVPVVSQRFRDLCDQKVTIDHH